MLLQKLLQNKKRGAEDFLCTFFDYLTAKGFSVTTVENGTSIGMGLAVCKKIFELHGFWGYCRYNEGIITFTIEGDI